MESFAKPKIVRGRVAWNQKDLQRSQQTGKSTNHPISVEEIQKMVAGPIFGIFADCSRLKVEINKHIVTTVTVGEFFLRQIHTILLQSALFQFGIY